MPCFAIDASAIPARMAGAGVYTYQLVRAMAGLEREHQITVFARRGLFDDLAGDRFEVMHVNPRGRGLRLAWEQTQLPFLLQKLRIDVLHSPHHHTPLIAPGVRRVVTFHDVTFLLLPDRYTPERRVYMTAVTRAAARIASAIITPSETVRRDVVKRLKVPEERVVAVAEAPGPQYGPVSRGEFERVRDVYELPERYVLSVGSLEPGKNRQTLFRAIGRLRDSGLATPVVVVGQPAWKYEGDFDLVRELELQTHVRFLGYAPDADLPALYSGAAAFAFPSLYEGFGLPVLEAMACGTPVVTSNGSATAEAAGDAALLIDPRSVEELTEALRALLTDEALHASLRKRGFDRARQFTWQRAARETLAVYEAAANPRKAVPKVVP